MAEIDVIMAGCHRFAQRHLNSVTGAVRTPAYLIMRYCKGKVVISHSLYASDADGEARADEVFERYRARRKSSALVLYTVEPSEAATLHPHVRSFVG